MATEPSAIDEAKQGEKELLKACHVASYFAPGISFVAELVREMIDGVWAFIERIATRKPS